MHFLCAFLILGLVYASSPPIGTGCACTNGGLCNTQDQTPYCDCPYTFLDSTCDKEATELQSQQITANLTTSLSYFFIPFNESTLLYIQIFLCPVQTQPDTLFFAHIDFQNQDGSLTPHKVEEEHSFRMKENQCVVAKYVIFPYKVKRDGELIRLVMELRAASPSAQASQINLSYNLYEFYKMENQNLAEIVIISTISSALLFCITFTICRQIVQRRMRRFVSHPAVPMINISNFDSTMPAKFYEADESVNQEDKQCMICLLNVENTMTRTTPCSHLFHKECIDQWGRKSLTCPACRANLHQAVI